MKNLRYALAALLMALSTALHATVDIRARHITSIDGIPNNTVRKIFQDSHGFIWLATIDGLCRYDGYSFVTLRPDQGDKISIPDNRIYEIKEDRNGLLWIATEPEIFACFDPERGQFVDYTGCGEHLQHYKHYKEDSHGNIWLTHLGNGIRRISYAEGKFSSTSFKTELGNSSSDMANCLYEDKRTGRMWVGFLGGVGFIEAGGSRVEMVDSTQHIFSIAALDGNLFFISTTGSVMALNGNGGLERVTDIGAGRRTVVYGTVRYKETLFIFTDEGGFEFNLDRRTLQPSVKLDVPCGVVRKDSKGNWWVFNQTGWMWYMDIESGEVLRFHLIPEDKVKFVDDERYRTVKDSNGILWIATYGNGLFAYSFSTGELQHFEANDNGVGEISTNFLQNVFEDRSGGIWVSSEYTGLTYIEVLNRGAERIFPEPGNSTDRANMVRMIAPMPDGGIVVGNRQGGVYFYDASLSRCISKKQYPTNVYCVATDADGRQWVGTRGNGLCIDGKWFLSDGRKPNTSFLAHVFCILRDSADRMWVGTFGGGLNLAVKTDDGGYVFQQYLADSYSQSQIRCITEDADGRIWAGTSDGLYVFRPEELISDPKGGYVHYGFAEGALLNDAVKALLFDSKGRMWIATGDGLSVCVPDADTTRLAFKHYGVADGLVNRMVQSVVEDGYGSLWISTEYGVSRFDPEGETFENFFFSNYSLGNYYSDNTGCLTADGKVLFGSGHGIVVITPELAYVADAQSFPAPSLTNLFVNGNVVNPGAEDSPLKRSLLFSDRLRLKHNQNSFTIEFSSFCYDKSQAVKYTYRLDKYDKGWSVPSSVNFATYKNLKTGSYTLRVKACSASGMWSDKETVLRVTITPPYWRTTWAYLIYVVLLLAALYVSWRILRNFAVLRQRIQVEKQLTEYKLAFFTNISHEFRTPLTLIEGALEKINMTAREVRSIAPSLKIMDKSTKRMLRLINQLLEFRRMQTGKLTLQLEEADVVSFVYEIFLSFMDAADSKSMDFQFHSSEPKRMMYIDKGIVDKVVYNIVSNAFKYTPCRGHISLDLKADDAAGTLMIRVTDTGVGIPKEKQGELFSRFMQSSFSSSSMGVGLNLSHELVIVHHGSISFAENEGGGSVFTVLLPLDKSVYNESDFLIADNVLMREEQARKRVAVPDGGDAVETADGILPAEKTDKNILVIEDDNDVREFLREGLSEYFDVTVAADGGSGLNKAKDMDFDLVICDVLMAGMNGFEVTEKLKGDFDTSHIPVILLTALVSEESHLHGVESGADAYITKPFGMRLLLTTVFKLIEQREALRRKFSSSPSSQHEALPVVTDRDKRFADRLQDTLEKHLGDAKFSVDDFATEMGIGRTAFYKKVRGITGYTPNEYIRIMRLKKAATLLLEENLNISEVAYKVGICDPFYFSKCFKQQFGVSPSAYVKSGGEVT